MKAIVIGGSGFIGSNVAMSLDAEKVVYYSRHENEVLNKKGIEHITGSVVETEKLQDAVKQFDMIIYSAGIFNDPQQTHDDVTLKGIKAVVDVIRKQDTGQKLKNPKRGLIHSHAGTGTYVTVSIMEVPK